MKISQKINKNALLTASISFLSGTLLLLFFLISQSGYIVKIGILYVLIAFVFNSITLVGLLANSIINYHHYRENLLTISLFLLNIPITIGYILLVELNPLKNIIAS
ncbi:hypothetical protein M0D21_20110 [Aquimarina sp. D1M17]|uniref:hypothetical protein n=1 Tax=Aquimarina acroporae TaxID=2937283 RepID=UPI0020BDA440|nr:hypothetical protein [Aquimarina acroporae]MCK8523892.1 hypothetical protein [Aquimarina acroporae]